MTILTLQPSAAAGIDTLLNQNQPTFNYGVKVDFGAGTDTATATHIAIAQFDFSSIPAGSTIGSAILSLYCTAEDSSSDTVIAVYRSLVQWFEGVKNGSAPDGGQDGSTFNFRNVNGSLTWPSSLTSESGSNWAALTDSEAIITTGQFFDWTVTSDVQGFIDATFTNYGWFIKKPNPIVTSSRKIFASSDNATAANRPKLVITYYSRIQSTPAGTSTAVGTIHANGILRGSANGIATVTGNLVSNQLFVSVAGTSTVSGTMTAQTHLIGVSAGTSTAIADITADADMVGSASGTSAVTAIGSFEGQLRGVSTGSSSAIATGLALARHVALAQGCYADPLLYITDGSIKTNGQLNRLDLIDRDIGYLLNSWRPTIAQYKEGGTFSDSPHGTGRRLTKRVFANSIEIMDLKARGHNQNNLIDYTHELFIWQEAAADYWTGMWADTPIYLVAKAAMESSPRYAIIHMMSVPELDNPYAQAFYGKDGAVHEQLTLRIERGEWTSNPPGQVTCVAISSIRSWTVSAWTAGV